MKTNETIRQHPDDPAEGADVPDTVDNSGEAAEAESGHETGGGHDDMGPGSSGS